MKRIWKRITALALAAVLLCGASPAAGIGSALTLRASAATVSGECGESVSWSLDTDTGVLSVTGTGAMKDYGYYEAPWYSERSSVRTVVIGDGVTSIGSMAFWYCTSLASVTIPDSVTSIEYRAFRDCTSLANVTIPDSVTSIGRAAFEGCTSLASVTIPDSVTSIGHSAFSNTAVYKNSGNWTNQVLYIGNHLICAKDTLVGAYAIVDGTVCIADSAFNGCTSLASVTIPDSVTSIGNLAFHGCTNLKTICYAGTSRENITIEAENDALRGAKWYYHRHDVQTETTTVNAVTPTCTRTGYSGDVYYAPCGVLKQTGEILPALGHDFGAWTLTQAPTVDAEGTETRACARCGAEETRSVPKLISAISIRNYAASTETYAYRSTITFFADVKNPVLGAQIRWYVDGREYSANDSCTVTEADHSFTIQAKYVRGNDVLAESEIEKVNVNTGFFAKIIAFFRGLFGRLPKIVQAYLGVETREKQADRPAAG